MHSRSPRAMDLSRAHALLVELAGALRGGQPGAAAEAEAVLVKLAAEAEGDDREEDSDGEFRDGRVDQGRAEAGEKGIGVAFAHFTLRHNKYRILLIRDIAS